MNDNASGEQPQGPMFSNSTHTGALKALEFNPFQSNLVATGAANAEVSFSILIFFYFKSYSACSFLSGI